MLALLLIVTTGTVDLRVELPIDDTPFNQRHGFEPSMEQSLALTLDLTVLGEWAIDTLLERAFKGKPGWSRLLAMIPLTFAWSVLLSQVPLGMTWMHEEWHRAVLTSHGVRSHNGVYTSPPFSFAVSVDRLSDAELAAFKASAPLDFVRMSSAGLESQTELNRRMQRQWFFDDRAPWREHAAQVWTLANSFIYLALCAGPQSDEITASLNAAETDVSKRDFTGMDCTGWAYDLEHPDEPYSARGVHPSGVGIDRYRSWKHLSPEGQSFVQSAMWLSLLGFVTPQWVSKSLPGIKGTRWTFAFFHQLTPFGQTVDFDLYLRLPFGDFIATYHQYFDMRSAYPGLELGIIRAKLSDAVRASATVMGWLQPQAPGGMLRLRAEWLAHQHAYLFGEFDAKTAGWVSGVVYTQGALQLRLGVGVVL